MIEPLITAASAKAIGSTLQGLGNAGSYMNDQKQAAFFRERGIQFSQENQYWYDKWRRDPNFRQRFEAALGRELPDYEDETTYLAMAEIAERDGWTLYDVFYVTAPNGKLETHYGYAYSKGFKKAYHPMCDPVYNATFPCKYHMDGIYHEIKRDVDPKAMLEIEKEKSGWAIVYAVIIFFVIMVYSISLMIN